MISEVMTKSDRALVGSKMHTGRSAIGMIQLLCMQLVGASSNIIRLGYLTGSQRLPTDLLYNIPGKTISGAISLAVDEINSDEQVMHSALFNWSILLAVVKSAIRR